MEADNRWKGYDIDELQRLRAKALIRRDIERQRMLALKDAVEEQVSERLSGMKGLASLAGLTGRKPSKPASFPMRMLGFVGSKLVNNYRSIELAYLGIRLAITTLKTIKRFKRK